MENHEPVTLWTLIESLQRTLEKSGVDSARADAAITTQLGKLLPRRGVDSYGLLLRVHPQT